MAHNVLPGVRYRPIAGTRPAEVSVVIPCYNYGRFLSTAVDSVLSQRDVDVDVIVVDDASTDDSVEVAKRLAAKDSRIRVIAHEANAGPVATFNRGLAAAKGEYLVRLDADDLLTPGSLRRAVDLLQSHDGVGLVYGHPVHFSGSSLPPARTGESASWIVWSGSEWLTARCLDGTNTITSPEVVMRRSVVDMVGGQRPLAHTHDMEMWLRMSTVADVGYVTGVDQAWHRDHPASLSTSAEEPLVILAEIRDAFDTLFDGRPDSAHDDFLRARAHLAVAGEALDQTTRLLDRGISDRRTKDLLLFAETCAPVIVETRRWARISGGAERRSAASALMARGLGVLPRLGRRIRFHARYARWERTGVYERLRLTSAPNRSRVRDLSGEHE